MKKYCKHCGSSISLVYGERLEYCPVCKKELTNKDLIHDFVVDARINQLKAMHELMCEANDEDIYMTWIYTMPDCPTEEDFRDFALDDEGYNECFDLFLRLINDEGARY